MQKTGCPIKNLPIRLLTCQIFKYLEFKDILKLKITCKYFNKKLDGYRYINKFLTRKDFNKALQATHLMVGDNFCKNFGSLVELRWLMIKKNYVTIYTPPINIKTFIVNNCGSHIIFPLNNRLNYFRCDNYSAIHHLVLPNVRRIKLNKSNRVLILDYSNVEVIDLTDIKNTIHICFKEFITIKTIMLTSTIFYYIKFVENDLVCKIILPSYVIIQQMNNNIPVDDNQNATEIAFTRLF